ncbi:MAG: TIM barrel protein [Candidatus Aenigmarchaeota archaeon]|nr:TIM barrel protein [Candidatus Aenigmarchaeota archaeon]
MPLKIHIGPAGNCISARGGTIDSFKRLIELNLNAQEIEFVRGVWMTNSMAQRVGNAAKEMGIKLSIHAPYYINLCNPEKLRASEKRIMDSCERAYHLGARVVVFHPGYYGKLSESEALENVIDACKEMSKTLDKKRIRNVFLGLETTGKKSQFGTLDEIIEICEKVKHCTPVIDFAHIYARNGGKIDYKKIFDKVKVLRSKFLHAHFSSIEFTDKGEKRHIPVSNNEPDFRELAKEILKREVDITIICESPLLEKDASIMKNIFEDLGYKFD